ncbi:MAG: proline--tRNA ligase [Oscillospiraceae bacterium]|jgi:prolyl-tRNA synthetase|nr:proline--tRNA ligase [Oscillospiraceae bacterium]
MSGKNKLVEEITARDDDFAKWYTDIVKKAELMDYSGVKGCMIIRPYGFAMWENIKEILDKKFKDLGHENVAMPLLIPENLLQKEKDHIEGFAPEVAWVTECGNEKLTERLCIRPTSETLFCEHYSRIIKSYRDLPKLYNQWCSIIRWEKTSRPFLRSVEIFWQEGHTVHETSEEAKQETQNMLNVYADFFENCLSIPVILGKKTPKEKFSGAEDTYTVEALMYDGKALQSATSHYFSDKFSRAFDITFRDRQNGVSYPFATSWGIATRVIGGIIMVHGDDSGLVLPPLIAPIQVVIIPISKHREGVLDKAREIFDILREDFRVKIDDSDQSPGWKFSEYEMKGVPVRLEIGPRDIENDQCVLVRRDNMEKSFVKISKLKDLVFNELSKIKSNMYKNAQKRLKSMINVARNLDEFIEISKKKPGLIKAMWCKDEVCENKLREVAGVTSRCIPFEKEQEKISTECVCCGRPCKAMVYWGKAY